MRGIESIIAANKAAVKAGVIKAGTAVGTGALDTKGHSDAQGGLRGHSIGKQYPFTVVGVGYDGWQVQNLLTGEVHGGVTEYGVADRLATDLKQALLGGESRA